MVESSDTCSPDEGTAFAVPQSGSALPSRQPVGRNKPPGPAGACHRAGQRPDPVGRPDDKLRKIRGSVLQRGSAVPHCASLHAGYCTRSRHKKGNAMKTFLHMPAAVAAASLLSFTIASPAAAEDPDHVLRLDHYVGVRSTVPAIAGQTTPIYVREVVRAASALRDRNIANRVVLFIHGAGTPAEVAFDVPYQDYSWMEYLAQAGFDTFAMDTTGYGRSTRPAAMNDPCNLSAAQQQALAPDGRTEACTPSYGQQMTTIASDWNDIGAVVDYLRAMRR